jgi:hypothetical protein
MKRPEFCILDDDQQCDGCGMCGEDFDDSEEI